MKFSIKQARQYGNFSQAEMAKALHVGLNTYRDYENYSSAMRIPTASAFSKLTKVPMTNIIFYHESTDKV